MGLKIVIWNVEHGNAISIITPNRKRILHDIGANGKQKFSPVEYSNSRYGAKNVDALIITHPHRDHIDDILKFCEKELHKGMRHFVRPMSIERDYLESQKNAGKISEWDLKKYEAYFDLHEQFPNAYISKNSPLNPMNNGGVKFEFFKPKKYSLNNINNHSIVTTISYLGNKIMLTGDNEQASWKELLSVKKFREAISGVDIFMASHHGRVNGYYAPLFEFFSPKLVLISDGPGTNTNAVGRYFTHVKEPYDVYFKNQGRTKNRKCLTTRKDRAIILNVNGNERIEVKTAS